MKKINYAEYLDKVHGCFIGKAVSGTIGAPFEGVKMPMELEFSPDLIDLTLPNDDLDLQVLWLDVVAQKGINFTSYDLLDRFVNYCRYAPGEYAVMRKNYNKGIYPPLSGKFCNDYYTEGMGCPIRSEIWACLSVGNPSLACELAGRDGCLDHYGESIIAECFMASIEALAFFESDIPTLIDKALTCIPSQSKFCGLVNDVVGWCKNSGNMKEVLSKILYKYGHPDCTNMFQNMGITIAALLLGECDIIKTTMLALNCGFDTDCTCATSGALIGLIRGAEYLEKHHGFDNITYALKVDSVRRSNKISDLAEDIALIGAEFTKDANKEAEMSGIPENTPKFEKEIAHLTADFSYENDYPSFGIGESRKVTITFSNTTGRDMKLFCSLKIPAFVLCDRSEFDVEVKAKGNTSVTICTSIPTDAKIINDRNIFELSVKDEVSDEENTFKFGISGAVPWKVAGPIWRTEPISTTEKLKQFGHYSKFMETSLIEGNRTDKTRHFHLNFATDTETEFLTENECFAKLDESKYIPCRERLFNAHEDSFRLSDVFSFRGPCVAYFMREIPSAEEQKVFIQVGYTTPFALYLNGEKIASRDNCDNWTAENVHVCDVMLKAGVNRLTFRVTRTNDDAKFNVTFAKGAACAEHIVYLSSINPREFI